MNKWLHVHRKTELSTSSPVLNQEQLRPNITQVQSHLQKPQGQMEIEEQEWKQQKLEATKLQIQAKNGTITPDGQERLNLLQTQNSNWLQNKLQHAERFGHNLTKIPINPPDKTSSLSVQPKLTMRRQEENKLMMKPEIGIIQRAGTKIEMTDEEKIKIKEKMAQKRNSQPTNVVLSFGAANGGSMFAQWLRQQMTSRGYKTYLDSEDLPIDDFDNTEFELKNIRDTAGGVASLNENWNEFYKDAMSQAHTMIFILTKEWFKSTNCANELNYFIENNKKRQEQKLPPLSGVFLTFPESEISSLNFPNIITIPTTKKYAVNDETKRLNLGGNYREFWTVEDKTLDNIAKALKK